MSGPRTPATGRAGLLLAAALTAGCADLRLFRAPLPPAEPPRQEGPAAGDAAVYRIGCPDVLELTFADRPGWDSVASIGIDGRLPVAEAGRPRVEGLTLDEARHRLAGAAGLDPARVTVSLAAPRSGRVYVFGPENGRQRAVPYHGPERALDLLRRVGALKPGSTDVRDVSVVRPNVAAGTPAEVVRVDLAAIVRDGDDRTNVEVRAADHVYVGETRRSSFARLLPKWARPLYERLVGLLPPDPVPWGPLVGQPRG